MKIAFKQVDQMVADKLYRAKTYSKLTYDKNDNVIGEEIKTRAKNGYDTLDIKSLEAFALLCPNVFPNKEQWEEVVDAGN